MSGECTVGQAAGLNGILIEMRFEQRLAGCENISHVELWAGGTSVPVPKGGRV